MLPIEGFFIVTTDDLIFEVKGISHPSNRLIAYLRYVPDEDGDRFLGGQSYSKIYGLDDREEYLKQKFPKYLWFDNQYGRIVQSVSSDDISFILNPVEFLSQLRDMGQHTDQLQQSSLSLAEHLVNFSGIEWKDIGLTGSQLLGLASKNSDIDLVIYGAKQGKIIQAALRNRFDEIPKARRYSGKWLDNIVAFRWGASQQSNNLLRAIEQQKILQGVYSNLEFFIRLVKYPEEYEFVYEDIKYEYIDSREVTCSIIDDQNSIYTPCFYTVTCESIPKLIRLTSYRGRFTEHVKKGMSVKACGRLETVKIQDQEPFCQLVMGEDSHDYLLPLEM